MTPIDIDIRKRIFTPLHIDTVNIDTIFRDTFLFDNGLNLDSVDALEILITVEREFGVSIPEKQRETVMATFGDLSDFIQKSSAEFA
jgi:acyl carrier protein